MDTAATPVNGLATPAPAMPIRATAGTRQEQSKVASELHLAFLDGIRGLASLYVVFHHVWLASYPRSSGTVCGICLDAPSWSHWLRFGHLAVAIFIVVSGFSLSLSPVRHGDRLSSGYLEYMRRRAFRILPPYWIALLLSCLVVASFTQRYTGMVIDGKAVAVHGLLLNNVIDSAKPNGTFWSIAVEWQIYFVFPLLLLLCRRFGAGAMVLATCACVVGSYLLGTHHSWIATSLRLEPDSLRLLVKLLHFSPQFLALFALGVLAAHATSPDAPYGSSRMPWMRTGLLAAIATVLALWLVPVAALEANFFWVDLLAGVAVAALLAGLARHPHGMVVRWLSGKIPRWLGQSSYSLYLVHAPILELILFGLVLPTGLSGSARFAVLFVIVVPAALLGSRLFWRIFELPFIEHRSLRGLRDAYLNRRVAV